MVAPEDQQYFESEIAKLGMDFLVRIQNVERAFDEEKRERLQRTFTEPGQVTFGSFMFYGEVMKF